MQKDVPIRIQFEGATDQKNETLLVNDGLIVSKKSKRRCQPAGFSVEAFYWDECWQAAGWTLVEPPQREWAECPYESPYC